MSGTRIETAPLPVLSPSGRTAGGESAGAASEVVPMAVAEPQGVLRGGIVVLHEAHGVTPPVLALVEALAREGWLTVAPHLYHRATQEPAVEADELAAGQVAGLTGATVLADCDGAFGWLAQRGVGADRIGVVGFDTGGSVALVVAASRNIGAAVSVAGGGIVERLSEGLPALVEAAPSLACPWLGLYGEDDPEIPVEQVEALRDAAVRSEVATNVVTYPAFGHRFDVDADDGTGSDARERVFAWLDSHLR